MFSPDSFLSLKEGISIHLSASTGYLIVPNRKFLCIDDGSAPEISNTEHLPNDIFKTEQYLLDFLCLLDGKRTVHELSTTFIADYGDFFGPVLLEKCLEWLFSNEELYECHDVPSHRHVPVTGLKNAFYPMHATLEIIETCNFACDHCYYSSSPYKTGRLSLDKAILMMDVLRENGVRVLELTGGECTIHPNFFDILDFASKTFDLVAIISNGYAIGTNPNFIHELKTKKNLLVQISIDALEQRHDQFRKHKNAFSAAVKAVKRLRSEGIFVRIASSISKENVDQIEGLYKLGKALDVQKHAFAPVAPLGRGCNVTHSGHASKELIREINEKLQPFASDTRLNNEADIPDLASDFEKSRNCGAGSRTYAIDYDGYVRACNLSRNAKKFGNVLEDRYDAIFGQRANYLFANAPSPGGKECLPCPYLSHCQGCFVKAFMISETEFPECAWRKKWFPDMSLELDHNKVVVTDPAYLDLPSDEIDDVGCGTASCSCRQ